MARVLIVACGCRGRALGTSLRERGHRVRGTSRDPAGARAIEAAGLEPAVADPLRLATLVPAIEGVGVLCWLLGSATGDADELAAIHGQRLESLLRAVVDTPVRGVVYEAAGTVPEGLLRSGAELVTGWGRRFRVPTALITDEPDEPASWSAGALEAVERVLSP